MNYWRTRRWNSYPQNQNSGDVSPPSANARIFDPSVKFRLEALLANPSVQKNDWVSNFCKSLLDQYNQKGYLSSKQVDVLTKNELKFDPKVKAETDAEHETWKKVYNETLRQIAIKVSTWYKRQHEESVSRRANGSIEKEVPFYYQNVAEKVLGDPSYIPTKDQFEKLTANKYAARYDDNTRVGPKFKATDVVKLNSTGAKKYKHHFPFENGLVINVEMPIRAVAGGYIVSVLPTGTTTMIDIEERFLRIDRDCQ